MDKIILSVATLYSRKECMVNLYNHFIDKVDEFHIYPDDYPSDFNFAWYPKAHIHLTEQRHHDNGKFLPETKGWRFTIDDDILYPGNYIEDTIKRAIEYECVVTYHGATLIHPVSSYYRDRIVYSFTDELLQDKVIEIAGTGCLCYHTDIIYPLITDFKTPFMSDIYFSNLCKKKKVPRVCLKHEYGYLKKSTCREQSISRMFKNNDTEQTMLCKLV